MCDGSRGAVGKLDKEHAYSQYIYIYIFIFIFYVYVLLLHMGMHSVFLHSRSSKF